MRAVAVAGLRTLPRIAVGLPPRLRRRLLALLAIAAVLGAAYLLWFRDSSFVRVEKVTVTGLTTHQAPDIRAALVHAARGMSTLDLDEGALRHAVAGNPIVRSISAAPQFPHALRIEVVENVPRALLVGDGRRLPVAGNGTVLPEETMRGSLPTIQLRAPLASGHVGDAATASLVSVAAAAPPGIVPRLDRVTRQSGKGIVVQLRRGPTIYFGAAANLDAKWAVAVAILADRGSQGATYVDVRLPDRPVAGGLHVDVAPPPDPGPAATATSPTPQALPQSANPQSATPQTATPQSATPQSATQPQAGPGG